MPSAFICRQASTIACRTAASSGALTTAFLAHIAIATALQPERIRVVGPAELPRRQRGHGVRAVEPDISIELFGQRTFGIMAPSFRFRTIDHSDEAFESRGHELGAKLLMPAGAQIEQETADAGMMRQPFVAVGAGWIDVFDLHLFVPIGGASDGPLMRAEADQRGGAAE